jgi:hypothetical protein
MLGVGRGARRGVVDFAVAFMLFWTVALTFGAGHSHASTPSWPVLVRAVLTPGAAPARPASLGAQGPNIRENQSISKAPTSPQARLQLSLAFATLAAVNLGFWRHLCRVYASPRRRRWRRG